MLITADEAAPAPVRHDDAALTLGHIAAPWIFAENHIFNLLLKQEYQFPAKMVDLDVIGRAEQLLRGFADIASSWSASPANSPTRCAPLPPVLLPSGARQALLRLLGQSTVSPRLGSQPPLAQR